jgi:hypothetical protein
MCIQKWFGGGGDDAAQQQLALAKQQQQQAAAAIANSNLDTESSRVAAEQALRKAAASQGFSSTLFGGTQQGASVGFKALTGQ